MALVNATHETHAQRSTCAPASLFTTCAPFTLLACVCVWVAGCATAPRVDPALYGARTFALASVHARASIDFHMTAAAPMLEVNDLGTEALEMELGEGEVRLAEILGGTVVPPGKVLLARKAYDALPEQEPAEAWTQVNGMTAVDLDDPRTIPALAGVAQALRVDAAIVVRHEWTLVRDRFEMGDGATLFDRCTILVVGKDGRPLWSDAVVARAPMIPLIGHDLAGGLGIGMNGATWGDEALQHARRTSKMALDELERRYLAACANVAATGAVPAKSDEPDVIAPPPPLE